MNIELRLAWRNLWRHKKRTWITVAAMVFSNVLLVLMLSLQLGSYQMMIDNALGLFSGQIQIQHQDYLENPKFRDDIVHPQGLVNTLKQATDLETISSRGVTFALVSSASRSYGVQVVGVEPQSEPLVSTIPGLIIEGRYLQASSSKQNEDPVAEVVLGKVLARNLKVGLGDELTLLGSGRDGSFAAGVATVVGIFNSSLPALDRTMIQLPLDYFQHLFASENRASYVVLNSPTPLELTQLNATIAELLAQQRPDESLQVRDWDALQPGIRQAIQADLSSAAFMYGVLILLVAFSVMNTQLMSVLERTREFGTMMALGLKPWRLVKLIFLETTMMATLGMLLGAILGAMLTQYYHVVGFYYPGMEEMAAKFNLPERFYPDVTWFATFIGPIFVMIASIIAAIYPALKIRKLDPISAMRAV